MSLFSTFGGVALGREGEGATCDAKASNRRTGSIATHAGTALGATFVVFAIGCGGASPNAAAKEASNGDASAQTGGGGGTSSSGGSGNGSSGSGSSGTGGATSTATGGAGNDTGDAQAGTGGVPQVAPPHIVSACDKLGAVGVWENITPSTVDLTGFGISGVQVDPHDSAVIYIGTQRSGLLRSPDCGATWVHIDTGTLGASIDKGTVGPVIDPIDSSVMYTGSLYGTNGLFKSKNGGVDWASILSPDVAKYAPYGGFIGGIAMDPGDHLHLLVTWHASCASPYTSSCFAETKDGGVTWTMRNGDASWTGGEGAAIQFLDSTTWLFSSSSNGMWRSVDEGKTWTKVPGASISHGAGQLYRTDSGAFFLGSATGVLYSPDGVSWSLVPNSGTLIAGVTGDGETVWTGTAYPYNTDSHPAAFLPYHTASVSAPTTWTTFTSPKMTSGGTRLAYDPSYHVLYSANYWEGVWRVVVK
jgi:hypothetical protein